MPNAKIIKKRLLQKLRAVCEFLLPNGYCDSGSWRVGNIRGDSGQSLSVNLVNGLWNDFAEDGEHRGDIFNLWMLVRGVSFAEALAEAEDWLWRRPTIHRPCVELKAIDFEPMPLNNKPEFWDPRIESFWNEGSRYLRNDPELQTAIDEWRGWPHGTSEALCQLDLFAYLSSSRDPRFAFKVECPGESWLTPVGYHARSVEAPPDGKASWLYRPCLGREGRSIPALPFVLGGDQFKEANLVVICEGQWDAITWAATAGWLTPGCPMPPGVIVLGIRGAAAWQPFLKYWGTRWPARAAFLLIPDGDDAGKAWHGDFARALAQRADKVVILDPPQGRDFSDINDETPFDPTAIQRLLQKFNLPTP